MSNDPPSPFTPTTANKHNHCTLNICLVRHAESYNNVILAEYEKEINMRMWQWTPEHRHQFHLRRSEDPRLSSLGELQAENLPNHPVFSYIRLQELAQKGKVRLVASPMQRTIDTALPLAKALSVRIELSPIWCEAGGLYTGISPNLQPLPGKTPEELAAVSPWLDISKLTPNVGWWGSKTENSEEFMARVLQAEEWLFQQASTFYNAPVDPVDKTPSYLIIVTHSELTEALLKTNLGTRSEVSFHLNNTAVTHFVVAPPIDNLRSPWHIRFQAVNAPPLNPNAVNVPRSAASEGTLGLELTESELVSGLESEGTVAASQD